MFNFTVVGSVIGMNRNKDGSKCFLKVMGDPVEGVAMVQGDSLQPLDIECSTRDLVAGLTLGGRVVIEGSGYNGGRLWKPQDGRKEKIIDNPRFFVRTMKLAK